MSIKQVNHKLSAVSMNGRMAYIIMCVETFLVALFTDRDWSLLANKMWLATTMRWLEWTDLYCCYIPDVVFRYKEYNFQDYGDYMTEEEFVQLKQLYYGITDGIEDEPNDPLNYMLNKPFEIATVFENTGIGDGKESFEIIDETEKMLIKYGIELPDYEKVKFSSFDQFDGWGDYFDGRFLSIILNK